LADTLKVAIAMAQGCAYPAGLYPWTDGILTMQDAYCKNMDEQEQGLHRDVLLCDLNLFIYDEHKE
jgi:hypothetical protein